MGSVVQALPTAQYNPYLEDASNIGNSNSAYYQTQSAYTAPAQPVSNVLPAQVVI